MAGGRAQFQDVIGVNGYLSQGDPRPHFGLGTADKADLVAAPVARRQHGRVEGREGGPGPARRAGEEVEGQGHAPGAFVRCGVAALAAVAAVAGGPAGPGGEAAGLRRRAGLRPVPRGQGRRQPVQPLARTAHSKAWASLATPEAKAMARLSGIPDEPEKAPICLGCHATAADSEKWERDAGFRLEDGVQCEKCHGPGSEYMDEAVMRDPEAARRRGCASSRSATARSATTSRARTSPSTASRCSTSRRPGRRSPTPCPRAGPRPARAAAGDAAGGRGPKYVGPSPAARATRARGWATSSASGA